jgi:lipopolysaccharide transport system ATP-binding protein
MSDSVIRVENLGKRYVLSHQGARGQRSNYKRFSDVLINAATAPWRGVLQRIRSQRSGDSLLTSDLRPLPSPRASREDFWALKDVSFEVKRGDVVGIIGRNGAGKSTLLKILSRITEPTTGRIEIDGRVASLLEVGTGFHPELTGRENIFLNGAILGMMKAEIKRKFDEIVAFAEVEKFLDTPVKHYSSGMYVRLAFAVAAHLEPEILICDEVLSVGDVQFQQKCMGKMKTVAENEGRTVLLVSHNVTAISNLCTAGICLSKGQIVADGNVMNAIAHYRNTSQAVTEWLGDAGDDTIRLDRTWVVSLDRDGAFDTGAPIQIGAEIRVLRPVQGLVLGFTLLSGNGQILAHLLFDDQEVGISPLINPCTIRKTFRIPLNTLAKGTYHIEFDVGIWSKKRIITTEGYLTFHLERNRGLGLRFPEPDVPTATSLFRPDWHENLEIINLTRQNS